MSRLQPPDKLDVQAAQAWLELDNYMEANEELEQITSELRAHPEVLKVRWEVYAAAKNWEGTLDITAHANAYNLGPRLRRAFDECHSTLR